MKKSFVVTVETMGNVEIIPALLEQHVKEMQGVKSAEVSTGVDVIVELKGGMLEGVRVFAETDTCENAYQELCEEADITPEDNYNERTGYQAIHEGADLE